MKTFFLVCGAMADEPHEELSGRTPMEVAKTPFLDELAMNADLASAAWLPAALPACDDVAAYSLLGYDPREFYTGLAPLEALGAGLAQSDAQMVFRCDFVTVLDGELVDPSAGRIPAAEASVLVKELNKKLKDHRAQLVPLESHKNLLFVEGALDDLDETECTGPWQARGQKTAKCAPKGKGAAVLQNIMEASRELLENHEVNRVRIDLGENPASQLWLWGQGRRPKLPRFAERMGVEGAFFTDRLAWRGLALGAGMRPLKRLEDAESAEFAWIESGPGLPETSRDYRAKIRRIEDFDTNVVGRLVQGLKKKKTPARIAVTSDLVQSTVRGTHTHTHAPLLVSGGSSAAAFNEKNCGLSGRSFDPGHVFLQGLLKG